MLVEADACLRETSTHAVASHLDSGVSAVCAESLGDWVRRSLPSNVTFLPLGGRCDQLNSETPFASSREPSSRETTQQDGPDPRENLANRTCSISMSSFMKNFNQVCHETVDNKAVRGLKIAAVLSDLAFEQYELMLPPLLQAFRASPPNVVIADVRGDIVAALLAIRQFLKTCMNTEILWCI